MPGRSAAGEAAAEPSAVPKTLVLMVAACARSAPIGTEVPVVKKYATQRGAIISYGIVERGVVRCEHIGLRKMSR